MSLGENLQHVLSRVHDALGVAVVGMDGMVVEERKNDADLDLQSIGAECCTLLRSANQTAAHSGPSRVLEMSVLYEENQVLMVRKINNEYFLILVLPSDREFGKGRFQIRRAAAGLLKEIA